MQIYILNGGPRRKGNTSLMCGQFTKGAKTAGAAVEEIHLFDLEYRGCYSCFACKLRDGKSYGKCGYPDAIKALLEKVALADGVVFASPIYLGDITGQLRSFTERLIFPFNSFDAGFSKIAPKHFETAVIYTMNVKEKVMEIQYMGTLGLFEKWISNIFSTPERICAYDTYQFEDYSMYVADGWDEKEKAEIRDKRFPLELENAYLAGTRMVQKIIDKGSN